MLTKVYSQMTAWNINQHGKLLLNTYSLNSCCFFHVHFKLLNTMYNIVKPKGRNQST